MPKISALWVISCLSRVGIILSFTLILLSIFFRMASGFGTTVYLLNMRFYTYHLFIIGLIGLIISLISNKQLRKIIIESAKNSTDLTLDKSQKSHIPVNFISFVLFIVIFLRIMTELSWDTMEIINSYWLNILTHGIKIFFLLQLIIYRELEEISLLL